MKEITKGFKPFIDGEHFFMPTEMRKDFKELDFRKAREIIEKDKTNIDYVVGGLAEDWGYTSATIFMDGKYVETDEEEFETFYGSSYWATPSIEINYKDGNYKMFECYKEGKTTGIPEWWTKEEKNNE